MGKVKIEKSVLIKQWLRDFQCFSSDGDVVFCNPCNKEFSCNKKHQLQQHVQTALHQGNISRKNKLKQTFLSTTSTETRDEFSEDLCRALVATNIPWRAIENPIFKEFIEKYANRHLPSESTIRKNYLGTCYDFVVQQIRKNIGGEPIWFSVDETTDAVGNYVANFIVGKLSKSSSTRSYLLCSKVLERTNSQSVAYFVNASLRFLYQTDFNDKNVLIMYSDAAPYMIAAGKLLRTFYPNLIHVTCLAHALNRVAEKIREEYSNVNKFISSVKKVFIKAPLRVAHYKEKLPNTALPPEPVLTRWGTWLKAVEFYSHNFEKIVSVINDFSEEDNIAIRKAKTASKDKKLGCNIAYISSNFLYIAEAIQKLEASHLSLSEYLSIVKEVETKINAAKGQTANVIKNKLASVLLKNPGYNTLVSINKILSGEQTELPEYISMEHIPFFKYALVTSVDVERSFSAYKLIFSEKRRNFTPENLEKVLVTYYFYNYN